MAITITDMKICAGGNHVTFVAVDDEGNDISFTKDISELTEQERNMTPHEKVVEEVKAVIKEAGAVSFDEMKAAVVKEGKR